MTIKPKFKIKQVVRSKVSDNAMFINGILVKEGGNYIYDCSTGNGDAKWFNEYELEPIKENRLGFEINLK